MLTRDNLHGYQNRAVDFILEKKKVALFLSMGLGKSISSLTAITDLIDSMSVNKVLVIAPLRVANVTWHTEALNWAHTKALKVNICTGNEKNRRAQLLKRADVYVINRENVEWLVNLYGKKWPFDAVIIDESSSFKSPSSRRFKALKKTVILTDYCVLLTGTPSPNGLLDLWAQYYLLDMGVRLGRTMTSYKQRFFESDYMGFKFTPRKGAEEKIHELLSDITLSMQAEDYIDVPKRIDNFIEVELPTKLQKQYKEFENELLLTLDDIDDDIEAMNAAVLANKLLQFCLSKGTRVLTSSGLINIENITSKHEIWDGETWVGCYGNVCNGVREVVNCYGIDMTLDHKVLTIDGWKTAQEILNGGQVERFEREYLRNAKRVRKEWCKEQQSGLALPVPMWETCDSTKPIFEGKTQGEKQKLRMYAREMENNAWYERYSSNGNIQKYVIKMLKQKRQRLLKLWGTWNNCMQKMVRVFREFLGRCFLFLSKPSYARQDRKQRKLFQRKLSMVDHKRAIQQHEVKCTSSDTEGTNDNITGSRNVRDKIHNTLQPDKKECPKGKVIPKAEKVYDLISCGKNNRFTVINSDNEPVIVHNCNGAIYLDDTGNYSILHKLKLDALEQLVEDNAGENLLVAYNFKSDLDRLKIKFPDAVVMDKEGEAVARWNAGEIKMLLAHPASAGHGLNLQHGGNIIVWFGLNWSLELYQQFNARLHRQGQTKPVIVAHIVAKGTIDEKVLKVLGDKDAVQDNLLCALK